MTLDTRTTALAIALSIGLPSSNPVVAASTHAPTEQPATSKPAPPPPYKTKEEAMAWLNKQGMAATPDSLVLYLMVSPAMSVEHVRAYLFLGAPVKERHAMGTFPLTTALGKCEADAAVADVTGVLLAAGADPNEKADDAGLTPMMAAAACSRSAVLKTLLTRKPDLNAVDAKGRTALHYAFLKSASSRDVNARLRRDAGFDVKRWRDAIAKDFASPDAIQFLEALAAGR